MRRNSDVKAATDPPAISNARTGPIGAVQYEWFIKMTAWKIKMR